MVLQFKEVVVIIAFGEKVTNMFNSMKTATMVLALVALEVEVLEKNLEEQIDPWLVD